MPECTALYAKAALEPFSPEVIGKEVCLPSTLLPLPSRKFHTRATVDWATGTGKYGFLAVKPGGCWTSATQFVGYSEAGYTGTSSSYPAFSVAAGATAVVGVVSPMSAALGDSPRVRLVSMGTRTWVTTPGLNRGGTLWGVQAPDRQDMQSGGTWATSFSQSVVRDSTARLNFGTEKACLEYIAAGPANPEDLEFLNSNAPYLANCWFYLAATSSAAQTFQTELIFHWEVIEINGTAKTMSHSDPSHSGAVVSALSNAVINNPGHVNHGGKWLRDAWKEVKEGWRAVSPILTWDNARRAAMLAGSGLALYSGNAPAAAAMAAGALSSKSPKVVAKSNRKK